LNSDEEKYIVIYDPPPWKVAWGLISSSEDAVPRNFASEDDLSEDPLSDLRACKVLVVFLSLSHFGVRSELSSEDDFPFSEVSVLVVVNPLLEVDVVEVAVIVVAVVVVVVIVILPDDDILLLVFLCFLP